MVGGTRLNDSTLGCVAYKYIYGFLWNTTSKSTINNNAVSNLAEVSTFVNRNGVSCMWTFYSVSSVIQLTTRKVTSWLLSDLSRLNSSSAGGAESPLFLLHCLKSDFHSVWSIVRTPLRFWLHHCCLTELIMTVHSHNSH